MRKRLLALTGVPRWVIQIVDISLILCCFALSYFSVKHFEFLEIARGHFFVYTASYAVVSFFIFYLLGIHNGLIRFSNMKDIVRIFVAVLLSSLLFPAINQFIIQRFVVIESVNIYSLLLINFFVSTSCLIMLRISVKEIFLFARKVARPNKERIVIYGADRNSILLKNALEGVTDQAFEIIGFLDGKMTIRNSSIEQKKVYRFKDLSMLRHRQQVKKLMLLNERLGPNEKKFLVEECLHLGISIVTVPSPNQWAFGKLSLNQIKNLNIEDLLQREAININNASISNEIAGKTVLVTGAAGSIGSELVRQLIKFRPKSVILCDNAESALHEFQLEITESFPRCSFEIFIGNIQNIKRMESLFKQYHPNIVFHAAAYKHVPLMENNPSEAVLANVLGTKNIAELAVNFKVEKFIMISTDKAVNPTNVMGASKRIAEMYVQSLNKLSEEDLRLKTIANHLAEKSIPHTGTKFITTRFGNVLGSNGSVLPRFTAQIQKGGPVTVTDPEITRYFMTIPEAVQLVLEAATMGQGGEIYVFDMGKPVKIVDLATQMIKLAGLEPGKDIQIEFTGLRQGEKLYEELLSAKETTRPTHHEKIKIANITLHNYHKVLYDIEELILLSGHDDDVQIVRKMKDIVPEFRSKNSVFEILDDRKQDKDQFVNREQFKNLVVA